MNKISILAAALIYAPQAFAQTSGAPGQPAASGQMFFHTMVMLGLVFLIFYFLVFSPQQKKLKAQAALLAGLKKGDAVVTSSGIMGRVAGVEKEYILLEIANNVRVKFEPSHVVRREEQAQKKEAA